MRSSASTCSRPSRDKSNRHWYSISASEGAAGELGYSSGRIMGCLFYSYRSKEIVGAIGSVRGDSPKFRAPLRKTGGRPLTAP